MNKGVVGVSSVLVILLLFLPSVNADSVLEADGAKGSEGSTHDPKSAGNIENWPQLAQEFCKKAQDNAIAKCQEKAREWEKCGWWVDRQIEAKGTYKGKKIDVNIDDIIVGRDDCPPPRRFVDKEGNLVEEDTYGETIDYSKYLKKEGIEKPPEEENVEITCSFTCDAWPCPEVYDRNRKCEDLPWHDPNEDGVNDYLGEGQGETRQEILAELRGRLQADCESRPGEFCKLGKCDLEEIPIKGGEGAIVLRACCECNCKEPLIPQSWDPDGYEWLPYDPIEVIGLVKLYNGNIDKAPSMVKTVFGNERIKLKLTDKAQVTTIGINTKGGRIIGVLGENEITKPTIKIMTTMGVIESIRDSPNPDVALVQAINDGSIQLVGLTGQSYVTLMLTKMVSRFLGTVQKDPFALKPGQKKTIVYKGQKAVIVRTKDGIRVIIIQGQRDRPVANRFGATVGYTNGRAQGYRGMVPTVSSSAGIYMRPSSQYAGYWRMNPNRPGLPGRGMPFSPRGAMGMGHSSGLVVVGTGGVGGLVMR